MHQLFSIIYLTVVQQPKILLTWKEILNNRHIMYKNILYHTKISKKDKYGWIGA
jgi:hypothetical protein